MNWFRQRTRLKRFLLLRSIGYAAISLAIGVVVVCLAIDQLAEFVGASMAALFAFAAVRDFARYRRCSPDANLEDP